MSAFEQGFGCPPASDRRARHTGGRRPKAAKEGTRGGMVRGECRALRYGLTLWADGLLTQRGSCPEVEVPEPLDPQGGTPLLWSPESYSYRLEARRRAGCAPDIGVVTRDYASALAAELSLGRRPRSRHVHRLMWQTQTPCNCPGAQCWGYGCHPGQQDYC